ncbi:uncharacterized protein LOC128678163 isoform X2 [Plodia interpunctella]|uniref:uncharacterized protein LOC128678163 isoform X2 n=1 Tax=Plodia interpunctella TaxID=58824 RepID=UPI002368C087|nr:uncharacterized protein LOC128678163 isoform X2 [Plodia interpunctella]
MASCIFLYLYGCIFRVDSRLELTPNYIQCGLNDILTISAPIVNHNVTIFHLTQPNGVTRKLNVTQSIDAFKPDSHENSVVVKYNREKQKVMTLLNNYKLNNVNLGLLIGHDSDIFEKNLSSMKENEFMIGPVSEEDHGNWVLSMYAKENGKWLEIFQVINIKIKEYLPPKEKSKTLRKGDTFRFGFAYPIPKLESCEFTAPKTTFDRWYDRDQDNMDHCMFVVNNVTKEDEGLWMVVGVGRIVYITQTFLNVDDPQATRSTKSVKELTRLLTHHLFSLWTLPRNVKSTNGSTSLATK